MKIAILASGLGIVQRGFEVAAASWAEELRKRDDHEVFLMGGGRFPGSKQVTSVTKTSPISKVARKLGIIQDGSRLQQISFAFFVRSALSRIRPDFVWLQEYTLASKLQPWIREHLPGCKLIFVNGAPVDPSLCKNFDFVIDLHPAAFENSKAAGLTSSQLALLPHVANTPLPTEDRATFRSTHKIPAAARLVSCVAAWNRHHKRVHLLIEAVAKLKESDQSMADVHLLLCGQSEAESAELKKMGEEMLGNAVHWVTLPPAEVSNVYHSSDIFVLPSKNEGLGTVLLEALAWEMPILVNDFPSAHFILGENHQGIIQMDRGEDLVAPLKEALVELESAPERPSRPNESHNEKTVVAFNEILQTI